VYGSSKPLPPTPSLHESVAVESLLLPPSSSSSPPSYSSNSSPIDDILPQKSSSSITDILLSTSSSYTTLDGDNDKYVDDLQSSNRIIPVDMWEKSTIYPVNEWVLNQMNIDPTIDDDLNTTSSYSSLIDKEYDAIKSYLNGQLCVSSLFYCIFTDYVNIYSSNNLLSEIIYKLQHFIIITVIIILSSLSILSLHINNTIFRLIRGTLVMSVALFDGVTTEKQQQLVYHHPHHQHLP
jgi:hypothetical protein